MQNVACCGARVRNKLRDDARTVRTLYAYAGDSAAATAENYVDPSEDNQEVLLYCAYASTVFAALLLVFTLIMLKRVAIAVAVIKVATQVLFH